MRGKKVQSVYMKAEGREKKEKRKEVNRGKKGGRAGTDGRN